jgi:hypothetical protein
MHVLMMSMYAAMAAAVLATVDTPASLSRLEDIRLVPRNWPAPVVGVVSNTLVKCLASNRYSSPNRQSKLFATVKNRRELAPFRAKTNSTLAPPNLVLRARSASGCVNFSCSNPGRKAA